MTKPKTDPVSSLFAGCNLAKVQKTTPGLQPVESELYCYNDSIDLDVDPLVCWSKRECQHPLLVKLVRMVRSLPSITVKTEQVFSAAGNVHSNKKEQGCQTLNK